MATRKTTAKKHSKKTASKKATRRSTTGATKKTSGSTTRKASTKRTATKRTATKRTATKRTATKRTATKRTATKRTATKRTLLLGLPATGDLERHLEAKLMAWRRKPKKPSDYVRYTPSAILEDGLEMVSRREDDLAAFAAQDIAVTARHFDWIELLVRELERLGVKRRLGDARVDVVRDQVKDAMARVLEARNALARRAEPNGIPVNLFNLRRAAGSPRALYRAALEVIDAAERVRKDFDSPRYAKKLIDELKAATEALGDVAEARADIKHERSEQRVRRQAVLRSLYDALLTLSSWGQAMAGGDEEVARRWRLDRTFPGQSKRKPEEPRDLVADATADVDDDADDTADDATQPG